MKRKIKLTEGMLHRIIENSVKRILKENINKESAHEALSQYFKKPYDYFTIDYDGDNFVHFQGDDGEQVYVYDSYESAIDELENDQSIVDHVDGATTEREWYSTCKHMDCEDEVFPNGINGSVDYEKLAKIILYKEGPEFFLASYDGKCHYLDNGMVAFREN